MHDIETAKAVLRKIRYQFPDNPEGFMWYSLLERAVLDLFVCAYWYSARQYLKGEMFGVLLCGVDPVWVREVLVKAGIDIEKNPHSQLKKKTCISDLKRAREKLERAHSDLVDIEINLKRRTG